MYIKSVSINELLFVLLIQVFRGDELFSTRTPICVVVSVLFQIELIRGLWRGKIEDTNKDKKSVIFVSVIFYLCALLTEFFILEHTHSGQNKKILSLADPLITTISANL